MQCIERVPGRRAAAGVGAYGACCLLRNASNSVGVTCTLVWALEKEKQKVFQDSLSNSSRPVLS